MKNKTIGVLSSVLILSLFSLGLYLIDNKANNKFEYNGMYSESILDEDVPVVNIDKKIIKPFDNQNVKEIISFYDYEEKDNQENSIIYYNNTYVQSTGIVYGNQEKFNVLSIYDGEVLKVTTNEILGNIIEIKHNDTLISIYQCVNDVKVKQGDIVKKGDTLAFSSKCNITNKSENILYFELINNGKIVNPNLYFDKDINEV